MTAKKVLLVDDQEDIRLLLSLTLEPLGFEVRAATNGSDALALAKAFGPDIVILDVMMPGGVDGYEVCQALRADPHTCDSDIIMLSSCGQQADIEKGRLAGASLYLVKPFSPLELGDIVSGMGRAKGHR